VQQFTFNNTILSAFDSFKSNFSRSHPSLVLFLTAEF
jgi:hypothetical protein